MRIILALALLLTGCASLPCGGLPRVVNVGSRHRTYMPASTPIVVHDGYGVLLPGACGRRPNVRALCAAFGGLEGGIKAKVAAGGDLIVYTAPSVTCR